MENRDKKFLWNTILMILSLVLLIYSVHWIGQAKHLYEPEDMISVARAKFYFYPLGVILGAYAVGNNFFLLMHKRPVIKMPLRIVILAVCVLAALWYILLQMKFTGPLTPPEFIREWNVFDFSYFAYFDKNGSSVWWSMVLVMYSNALCWGIQGWR